jgi:hypothetical protein
MFRLGHTTTYLLFFILAILAALLFVFKDNVFIQAEKHLILDTSLQTSASLDKKDLIDLEIFEDKRLKSMERNVPYFDFHKLGRTKPADMETNNLPIFDPVSLRNNQPFK